MPVTAPRIYAKQPWLQPGEYEDMLFDVIRFLCNNHASITGPGWTVVAADDNFNGRIDTPSGGTSLTDLPVGNRWNPNTGSTPNRGSWICLESLDGNSTNHCQVIIHFDNAGDDIRYFLLPYEDFVVPGATTGGADPTMPSTAIAETQETSASFSPSWISVAADESMFVLVNNEQGGVNSNIGYLGETDGGPGGRDFITSVHSSFFITSATGSNPHKCISPHDDVTELTESRWVTWNAQGGTDRMDEGTRLNLLGVDPIFRVGALLWLDEGLDTEPANHQAFMGWLRNVRSSHAALGTRGTMAGRTWMYINEDVGPARPGIAIAWDGSTDYP